MTNENSESNNPYAMPVEVSEFVPAPMPNGVSGGYVRQVKVLCILMIVQGALEMLVGIFWVVLGLTMPAMIANQQAAGGQQMPNDFPFETFMLLIYGTSGLVGIIAGLLRVIAGIRGLSFRGYVLGIVSHFFGMLNLGTCYCLPTALGLCIWGCIVYFNPEVKYAFKLGADGQKASDIEARMSGRAPY